MAVARNQVWPISSFYGLGYIKADGSIAMYFDDGSGAVSNKPAGNDYVSIAVSGTYGGSLALKQDGTIVGWGTVNASTQVSTLIPIGLTDVIAIESLYDSFAVLKSDGTVIYIGDTDPNSLATAFAGWSNIVRIAGGGNHVLGLQADGTVVAAGSNSSGQTTIPVGLSDVVAIDAGWEHSIVAKADGSVVAWGKNTQGQTTIPEGLTGVIQVTAGEEYSMALKSDGTVVAWGGVSEGESIVPIGLTDVVYISGDAYQSYAVQSDGTLVHWGANWYGEGDTPPVGDLVLLPADEEEIIDTSFQYYNNINLNNNKITVLGAGTEDTDGVNKLQMETFVNNEFDTLANYTKEPTGFISPDNVIVNYNSTSRIITLTGTVTCVYKGDIIPELISGWESEPHAENPTQTLFLKYNGNGFEWTTSPWNFYEVQIAVVLVIDGQVIGVSETHGLMPWQDHEEFHQEIGTYRISGGDLSAYTPQSEIATNRRPTISQCIVKDEDLKTTLPLLSSGYTHFYLSGTQTVNLDTAQTEIVSQSGNSFPRYNQWNGSAFVQTELPVNNSMSVWVMAVPVTSDANSQKYRFEFVQGQSISTTTSAELTKSPLDVNLGEFRSIADEFIFIAQIVLRRVLAGGAKWYIDSVSSLSGSKRIQIGQQGSFLTGVTGVQVPLDTSTFNENLDDTITNVQLLAEAVDSLGGNSITQITKMGRTENQEEDITLTGGTSVLIDVFKMDYANTNNVVTVERTFDNGEAADFIYTDTYVQFNGVASLITSYTDTQNSSVLGDGVQTSWDLSTLADFKSIENLEVS